MGDGGGGYPAEILWALAAPMKRIHLCQSVTGPLRNWSGKQWTDATEWITRKDGTRFASGEHLEMEFQRLADNGVEGFPIGDCDDFDPKTGMCNGHPITNNNQRRDHEKTKGEGPEIL